jgi:hypothetical protein
MSIQGLLLQSANTIKILKMLVDKSNHTYHSTISIYTCSNGHELLITETYPYNG